MNPLDPDGTRFSYLHGKDDHEIAVIDNKHLVRYDITTDKEPRGERFIKSLSITPIGNNSPVTQKVLHNIPLGWLTTVAGNADGFINPMHFVSYDPENPYRLDPIFLAMMNRLPTTLRHRLLREGIRSFEDLKKYQPFDGSSTWYLDDIRGIGNTSKQRILIELEKEGIL